MSELCKVGDRVTLEPGLLGHGEDRFGQVGTVTELIPPGPGSLGGEGGARIAWDGDPLADHPVRALNEGWVSYRSMLKVLPDFGAGDASF